MAVEAGFSLHADTAVHANDRQGLERLARYGARGPIAECRLRRLDDGRYEYATKKGTTLSLTAEALVRRLVALLPPARLHLTSFHGVYAPNAKLRPLVTTPPPSPPPLPQLAFHDFAPAPAKPKRPRLDWATLHRRTFGTDVLRCACGGRRRVHAVHTTRNAASERLAALGLAPPARPTVFAWQATAPPQLALPL